MIFESDISYGEVVYLLTDPDRTPAIVTHVVFTVDGGMYYTLSSHFGERNVYRCEIAKFNKNEKEGKGSSME